MGIEAYTERVIMKKLFLISCVTLMCIVTNAQGKGNGHGNGNGNGHGKSNQTVLIGRNVNHGRVVSTTAHVAPRGPMHGKIVSSVASSKHRRHGRRPRVIVVH
ncbi:MAG: hypothetical protein JWN76_1926 [Chitinophagaceae bacterium]|nr:hypothetical protein [Chitinophagaceae bacterium]